MSLTFELPLVFHGVAARRACCSKPVQIGLVLGFPSPEQNAAFGLFLLALDKSPSVRDIDAKKPSVLS